MKGSKMNWQADSWKKEYFLITPEEFEDIFNTYYFVVVNTGVTNGYVESDARAVFEQYSRLYSMLSLGKELNWKDDWKTVSFNIGITSHLDNCKYCHSTRLSVPDFTEPCVYCEPFCVVRYNNTPMSKGWALTQFPQNTIGLQISVPRKITYSDGRSKMLEDFSDRTTWNDIISKIKKRTKVLKVEYNDKVFNSNIRISQMAKEDLKHFFVVKELDIKLL